MNRQFSITPFAALSFALLMSVSSAIAADKNVSARAGANLGNQTSGNANVGIGFGNSAGNADVSIGGTSAKATSNIGTSSLGSGTQGDVGLSVGSSANTTKATANASVGDDVNVDLNAVLALPSVGSLPSVGNLPPTVQQPGPIGGKPQPGKGIATSGIGLAISNLSEDEHRILAKKCLAVLAEPARFTREQTTVCRVLSSL
jgi:hypothetical protein